MLILLSSVAGYLRSTNPIVFCGGMSGFEDKSIAATAVYRDVKWSFCVVSYGIFVLRLVHGWGGQSNGRMVGLGVVVSAVLCLEAGGRVVLLGLIL